jgi:poly-gamma-glutamate capsule biosynthesis protein CapA/YwtB (metallophosphatase superfamily)
MTKLPITFLGIGDILIDREKPETIFQHTAEILSAADITFANAEQGYATGGIPSPIHASYSDPRNIPALLSAGIDVLSLANNHTLDWGPEALLDTIANLKAAGVTTVGAGKNIAEARRPVIVERKGTKVGFLAYSCTGPDGYEAEEDKPGYAPVRVWTIYEKVDYQPATPPRIVSFPYKEEMAAVVEDIKKLKTQADVVIVSFHWGQHLVPRVIPMYCYELGHAAVDAGADLILGGHTHILKGIEVYKGKVIFYSLSNFACELGPGTLGQKSGARMAKKLAQLYGSTHHPEAKATLIVRALIDKGEIQQVSYIPCYMNEREEPMIVTRKDARGQEVFDYVEDISRSENLPVHFSWQEDEVLIRP